MIVLDLDNIKKANYILFCRKNAAENDTPELLEKREKWLSYLLVSQPSNSVWTMEMYFKGTQEPIKSNWDIPQFYNKWHNTRKKLTSETIAEIDKLPIEESIKIMSEFCQELIKNRIHFALFYAPGQRSPHIRIYDFDELKDLTPFQREQVQAAFWKKICPFAFHYLDKSVWQDEHPLQLEFAPHWKYGTPFNLLFEYLPEPDHNMYIYFDGGIRFNKDKKSGVIASAYKIVKDGYIIAQDSKIISDNGTTPEAEYNALILALEKAKELDLTDFKVLGDSEIIIEQVTNRKKADKLKSFCNKAQSLLNGNNISWIPRELNKADKLVKKELLPFRRMKCSI